MDYNRYRNRSTPAGPAFHKVWGSDGESTVPVVLPANTEQTYDTKIPQYRKRSALGEIFNNSFLNVSDEWTFTDLVAANATGPGGWTENHQWKGCLTYQSQGSVSLPISLDLDDVVRNAQLEALGNVNATDVDAVAFAGEWSKTVRLHRDLGEGLLKLFKGTREIRRKASFEKLPVYDERGLPVLNRAGKPVYRYAHRPGESKFKGSRSREAANLYLAGRYGVLPLLSDLENAVKFLGRKHHPRFTARGNAMAQGQRTTGIPASFGYYGTWMLIMTVTRTFEARYGILYEADEFTRRMAQLGLTRPLSSAWELLPWSFVGDWFLQVGQYLDAVQPTGITRNLSAWGGTRDTVVTTLSPSYYTPHGSVPTNTSWSMSWSGGFTRVQTTKSREPWNTAIPSRPALGSGFNAIRSGDFAALVLQKIKAIH